MTHNLALLALMVLTGVASLAGRQEAEPPYAPQRINKAIELLEHDQPIYYTQVNGGGYDEGKATSTRASSSAGPSARSTIAISS